MAFFRFVYFFVRYVLDIEGSETSSFRTNSLNSCIQVAPATLIRQAHRNEDLIVSSDKITVVNIIEFSVFMQHESECSARKSCDEDLTKPSCFGRVFPEETYSAKELKLVISDHGYKT